MGWIDSSGTYHRGKANPNDLKTKQQGGWKSWDHNRQRKDYAREVVQPYTRDGKPNNDFIQAWPDEAKETYGFNKE